MIGALESNVPPGPMEEKWTQHKFDMKLVAPNNRRKFEVIVVGSGLAGASAAATLGEQGYNVKVFTFHDCPAGRTRSPPRAGSTPPRTTRATATRCSASSTTP